MRIRKNKNRKGVSVMIGYILLIVFAVVIAGIIFVWLRTYIPSEGLQCPDGVSAYIAGTSFDCDNQQLNITINNNGRFDIAGFFVHVSNISGESVATIDFSQYLKEGPGSMSRFGNSIIYLSTGGNNIDPNDAIGAVFNFPAELGTLYSITLTPTRFQEEDNRERFVSCGNGRITQSLVCGITGDVQIPPECVPDCTGKECGDNGCGRSCGECTSPEVCETSTGQCVPPEECTENCSSLEYQCGTWKICGTDVNCTLEVGCSEGYECNEVLKQCEAIPVCGNGIIETGETCDDENTVSGDGCSSTCQAESGWTCTGSPSQCTYDGGGPSCKNYCVSLDQGYTNGGCVTPANQGQCGLGFPGSTYDSGGNQECVNTGGAPRSGCCCY